MYLEYLKKSEGVFYLRVILFFYSVSNINVKSHVDWLPTITTFG